MSPDDAHPILAEELAGAPAWTRDALTPAHWLVPLPDPCVAELDGVAARVRADPGPVDGQDAP
jgi:hypothetical protein